MQKNDEIAELIVQTEKQETRSPLTGLLFDRIFLQKADERLKTIQPNTYILVALDIEHFRLFNKLYGREEGDRLLCYIAGCLKNIQDSCDGLAGYFGADNFALLIPDHQELLEQLQRDISDGVGRLTDTAGFLPAFGVYEIEDCSLSTIAMYDRATIALSHVFGNFSRRICRYDASMVEKMEEELLLISEIKKGLENHEFTFYAQPQCDISSGKIVGAESLVRWNHKTKGIIPPGVFIPVLEKNGFIADLDKFIWQEVCKWLRSWIDRGNTPVPISVNISRVDIFSMDVPAYISELMQEYRLPTNLLKIEITESAYAEEDDRIVLAVKQLQDMGFFVMMDDFGSGYSSLNMLKSVAVDVLKLDMRFLNMTEEESSKGIGILESVINMSRQMGLPIIVEGVETKDQEKFLLNMGCRYAQGYYYYRPLPVEDFEKVLLEDNKLDVGGLWSKQVEEFHIREFLDSNLFSDAMLNNVLGPAAFYDVYQNKIEITRVNEQYFKLTGISAEENADYSKKMWDHIWDEDRQILFDIFNQARETPAEGGQGYVHYLRSDGQVLWIFLRVYYLREREGHQMFYGSLTDITAQEKGTHRRRQLEEAADALTEEQKTGLEQTFKNLPCPYMVVQPTGDEGEASIDYQIVYVNREMYRLTGNWLKHRKELETGIFQEETDPFKKKILAAAKEGKHSRHSVFSSLSNRYFQFTIYQYAPGYAGLLLHDVSQPYDMSNALNSLRLVYQEIYFIDLEENRYRMIYPDEDNMRERGNYEESITRHIGSGIIQKKDEETARRFLSLERLKDVLVDQDVVECKYHRKLSGVGEEYLCLTAVIVTERVNGIPKMAVIAIRKADEV